MACMIRVMYGDTTPLLKKFRFESDADNEAYRFDLAVKEINRLYKENGRFKTKEEVVAHFSKYGFYQIEA